MVTTSPAPAPFVGAVLDIFAVDPEAPALLHEGRWYRYRDLTAAVDSLRDSLRALGVGAGTPVGVVLPNSPAGVVTLVAVFSLGATAVTLSPRRVDKELVGAPPLRAIVRADTGAPDDLRTAVHVDPDADQADESFAGVAVLMRTSGTTGEPKRIEVTYDAIDASLAGVRKLAGGTREPGLKESVNIVCFPLLHLAGVLPLFITLMSGRRTALMAKFEPVEAARLIRDHQISSAALNPTALSMLLDAEIDPGDLASLRFVRAGSAPLSPELAATFEDRFGTRVIQAYGQTETGGEIIGWRPADHEEFGTEKRGSVGRPHPGVEVAIVTPERTPDDGALTAGESGELWVRGVRGTEGWHRTGDLAHVDEDGFVWIEGRADDVIICGGFNIAPLAVERALAAHPSVDEAAVVGVDDARLGQVPVGVVTGRADLDPDALQAWCRERLEPYQVPRRFVIVPELPRNEIGKVHRPSLAELANR